MTQFLPPNLLALFAARDPIPYKAPTAALSWEKDREKAPYSGVSPFMTVFEDPKDTPPPTRGETKAEKKARRIKEKTIIRAKEIEEEVKNYDPHNDRNATGDAFKSLFVGRINFDTSESKLRREFDMYGPIRKITMVKDMNGKPKGYAFIEFEHERDMHTAYKNADGRKIDGRRVLVDVERGRTVKGWRPLRLGGGLGATRRGANSSNPDAARQSGRPVDSGRPKEEERTRDHNSRRSPSRDKREKRTSRDREKRDRGDRKDRRDRDRDRERPGRERDESGKERPRDGERKHRNRDRSRERDRDGSRRKRSRDRDRKRDRPDRDRSDKDKDRKSRSDRDRDRERGRDESGTKNEPKPDGYPEREAKQDHENQPMDGAISGSDNYNQFQQYTDEPREYKAEIKQETNYDEHGDQNGDREIKQRKNYDEEERQQPEATMEY